MHELMPAWAQVLLILGKMLTLRPNMSAASHAVRALGHVIRCGCSAAGRAGRYQGRWVARRPGRWDGASAGCNSQEQGEEGEAGWWVQASAASPRRRSLAAHGGCLAGPAADQPCCCACCPQESLELCKKYAASLLRASEEQIAPYALTCG